MPGHPVVHIDIPASDPKAAGQFYATLFGWTLQHEDQYDYTMWQSPPGPGGGFVEVGEHATVGDVRIYVGTDDIEATLAKVVSLGGSVVMPKMDVGDFGAMAVFADPTGNHIGLWMEKQRPG
jgi:predicted enzyme related to lactoylglutathione lyase